VVQLEAYHPDRVQQLQLQPEQTLAVERHLQCRCWLRNQDGVDMVLGSHCGESLGGAPRLAEPQVEGWRDARMEVEVLGLVPNSLDQTSLLGAEVVVEVHCQHEEDRSLDSRYG
jgi:hypothetical protein